MAAFEINARFSDFATQWMNHRTPPPKRRRHLGRWYRKSCRGYAEKLWVWRHTVLNLIEAAKELQMFTGNSDTGMRCPPEPDRNWFVMDDRELSKFVQTVHAERSDDKNEPLSPLGQLAGGVGMKADAWMGVQEPVVDLSTVEDVLAQPLKLLEPGKDYHFEHDSKLGLVEDLDQTMLTSRDQL